MTSMPKWARIAAIGAISAVAVDYFLGPSLRKTFKA
jgi:hypothetical protein